MQILLPQGARYVARSEVVAGELFGIKPDAHGEVLAAERIRIGHAFHPRHPIAHLERDEVRQIGDVARTIRAEELHGEGEIGRLFARNDALAAHILRQARQCGVDTVLNEHLGFVEVGAQFERDGDLDTAIARARRRDVQHALHTVDFLFERRGDRFRQRLCVGAGIRSRDNDSRRGDFRILRDGQGPVSERANERDDDA